MPGREGSSAEEQSTYDGASLGFRVLVSSNGNRYTKTSMTPYASGGRITQEDTGGGAAGVDEIFSNASGALAVGDLVYLAGNDEIALASGIAVTSLATGVVTALISATSSRVRMIGEAAVTREGGGAYTPGNPVYLSATTPGRGTQTPPTSGGVAQMIGFANTTTTVLLGVQTQTAASILATSGSAAVPSIALVDYPTTGLYGAAANTLGFSVGGVAIGTLSGTGLALAVDNATTSGLAPLLTLTHTATGGAGANGIGANVVFAAEGAGGTVRAGSVIGRLVDVTAAAELGVGELVGALAGTLAGAGIRAYALAAQLTNGLAVVPSTNADATNVGVQLIPYATSSSTDIHLSIGGADAGEIRARSNFTFATSAATIGTMLNNTLTLLPNGNGNLNLTVDGTGGINLNPGDAGSGVAIGVDAASKVGFYATAPIAKQTGVLVTAGAIHAALVNLGLIAA